MAANDYYNSASDPSRKRADGPLPPLPNPFSSYNTNPEYKASATSPPFDDSNYWPHGRQSESDITSRHAYNGAGGGSHDYDVGPYADNIPLKPHQRQNSSDLLNPHRLHSDPEGARPGMGPRKKSRTGATRRKKKKGLFSGRIPLVTYFLTAVQIIVFIAELVKAGVLTGSPIEINPQFNPMIGPSPYVQINMGGRYIPCMRNTSEIKDVGAIGWPCPRTTSKNLTDPSNQCKLSELCGFGDTKEQPTQWWRFITPMFLHAGFVHIAFNMLLQLTLGCEMEKEIGPLRYALVYVCSGIFGFVLGGNFAAKGIVSTGASGALFGIIALMLLDLLYFWDEHKSPWVELAWVSISILVSLALGLLPGLDNFSHIGGFLMGLVLGVFVLHSPQALRQRIGVDDSPYAPITSSRKLTVDRDAGVKGVAQQSIGFFKGRKPLWWAWWLVRAAALIGVLAGFIALIENFKKPNPTECHWCKYLSCLPVSNWCEVGNLAQRNATNTTSKFKRDILVDMASSVDLSGFF